MILSVVLSLAVSVIAVPLQERANTGNVVGAYLLIGTKDGPTKLAQVAASAATLPINRVTLSFVRPDMYYVPGSNTLAGAGFNYRNSGDYGFAEVKAAVAQIQAAGVDVFLSMGGWDYNCWPYTYLRYSIAPYGGPNADVIKQYGNGNIDNCNASNQWCYACEPPSNGNTPDSFALFPEPSWSSVWKQATAEVVAAQQSKGTPAVKWHPEIYGGQTWVDPKTGKSEIVAGDHAFADLKRDPYQDFVYLAKDLGLAGIDLDYEEFWHADTFKTGDATCTEPCQLWQTVYKYTAIARDMQLSIQSIYPSLKFSTAAAAVGAWNTNWWGGNMKGLWYGQNQIMPAITKFQTQGANAGGLNVMSYDISTASDECPSPGVCTLSQQVDFYLNTYRSMLGSSAGIYVGYEIGTPAYPASYAQMANLSTTEWPKLLSNTQSNYPVNTVSQQLCNKLLPGQARCSGNLPNTPPKLRAQPTTTTTKQATSATTVKTSTKTTTKAATTTTGSSGGPVVGGPCTQGVSQCYNKTMYYCQGSKWIVWYSPC
ncbi:hypothetical protein BDR26DRAFT_855241 [Obelidium mucronatum]|nr:hypothetical protein BDR26DRAFT_855241 [Obelidium mucronatum]